MRLDHFLIGTVVFLLFIVGGTTIINDTYDNYDVNVTNDTNNFTRISNLAQNMSDDTYAIAIDMKNNTLEAESEGGEASWEALVKGAYSAIRLISNSFVISGTLIFAISEALGIPPLFAYAALTVLIISIIFAIIYLVFRFRN